MIVTGLDLSLTATGWCRIDTDLGTVTGVGTIHSAGRQNPPVTEMLDRIQAITVDIIDHTRGSGLVLVEGPSYGQGRQTGDHARAGLWWRVAHALRVTVTAPPVVVTPAQVKMYATGNGQAKKEAVLLAAVRRYPNVPIEDNNQADALCLASIGARHLDMPIEASLPQTHLRALDKITWPGEP